jgi:CRP-like cAMP-binding protein
MSPKSKHPLELLVRNLELHAALGAGGRAAILALPYRLKTFEASTYLVREGDRPTHCGVPISGFAYRQKQTGGGLRQIVSLHIPGEALDFQHLFLDVADHSIQMLTRGEVALIPLKEIQQLMQDDPAVGRAILTSILVEASIFREWVLNVGRRDARSRIAHLLCEFAIRMRTSGLAGDDGYDLPITQEQFADAVGLTAVHVNRTLRALETEGFVTRNKRTIGIPSWSRLRDVADFNQRYLHLTGPTAEAA